MKIVLRQRDPEEIVFAIMQTLEMLLSSGTHQLVVRTRCTWRSKFLAMLKTDMSSSTTKQLGACNASIGFSNPVVLAENVCTDVLTDWPVCQDLFTIVSVGVSVSQLMWLVINECGFVVFAPSKESQGMTRCPEGLSCSGKSFVPSDQVIL